MNKFRYLTKREWVDTWVNGGSIPIPLASSFLSDQREGTSTPDENLIYESAVDVDSLPYMKLGTFVGLTISGGIIDGTPIPEINNATRYNEDGLVLSLSNRCTREVAERLGKTACVEIFDVEKLKQGIDLQIGVTGEVGNCSYTEGYQRNHFLKSVRDAWQDECRVFWPVVIPGLTVTLPGGLAREIAFEPPLNPVVHQVRDTPNIRPSYRVEFTPEKWTSLKSLVIGYLQRASPRYVGVTELAHVALHLLQCNYPDSNSMFRWLQSQGLIEIDSNPGSYSDPVLILTEQGPICEFDAQITIPDPNIVATFLTTGGANWW